MQTTSPAVIVWEGTVEDIVSYLYQLIRLIRLKSTMVELIASTRTIDPLFTVKLPESAAHHLSAPGSMTSWGRLLSAESARSWSSCLFPTLESSAVFQKRENIIGWHILSVLDAAFAKLTAFSEKLRPDHPFTQHDGRADLSTIERDWLTSAQTLSICLLCLCAQPW